MVAIGSDQPNILLYSTISGEEMASLKGHSSRVKGLALSPDHNLLFSASSDGSVKVWAISETLVSGSSSTNVTKLILFSFSLTGRHWLCLQCGLWLQVDVHHYYPLTTSNHSRQRTSR